LWWNMVGRGYVLFPWWCGCSDINWKQGGAKYGFRVCHASVGEVVESVESESE
jgi:hypothetical protein